MTADDISAVIADQNAQKNEGKTTSQNQGVDTKAILDQLQQMAEAQKQVAVMADEVKSYKSTLAELTEKLAKTEKALKENNDEHAKLRRKAKKGDDVDEDDTATDKSTQLQEATFDPKFVIEGIKATALKRESTLIAKVLELKGSLTPDDKFRITAIASSLEDDAFASLSKQYITEIEKKIKESQTENEQKQKQADEQKQKIDVLNGTSITPETTFIPVGDGKLSYTEVVTRLTELSQRRDKTPEDLKTIEQYRRLLTKVTFG